VLTGAGLLDRLAIEETLYRYGACIDRSDYPGLRAVLADDVRAQYGNRDPISGADALVEWIAAATSEFAWQHHLLSVYSVEVAGDEAKALVYHTSQRGLAAEPTTAHVLVGRYHGLLRRGRDGWQISDLVLEILWAERRNDSTGYLDEVGGRGPSPP
jgi:ketosteroid isomerase-like protein